MLEKLKRNILFIFPLSLVTFFPFKNLLHGFSIPDFIIVLMAVILSSNLLSKKIKFTKFDLILILFGSVSLITFFITVKEWINFKYTIRIIEYVIVGLYYFHFINLIKIKNFIYGVMLTSLVLVIYALLQYLFPNLIIINSWGPSYKENYVLFDIIRVYSLLDNPLILLSFLTIIIGLILKFEFRYKNILLGLLYLIILLTGSRSALVIILISSVIIFFLKNTFLSKLNTFAISLLIALLVIPLSEIPLSEIRSDKVVVAERTKQGSSGIKQRMLVFKSSVAMLVDYPVWGIGAGNFKELYLDGYKCKEASDEESSFNSENFFLRIYLDHGLIPFLIISSLILYSLYFGFKYFNIGYIGHFTLSVFLFCFAALFNDLRSAPVNMCFFIILGVQLRFLFNQENKFILFKHT